MCIGMSEADIPRWTGVGASARLARTPSGSLRAMRYRSTGILAVSVLLLAVACESGADSGPESSFLSEGDQAPSFTLPSASDESIALSDFTGHKPVLLYFSMGPG